MDTKRLRVVQNFVQEEGVVELVLTKQQCLEIISVLASKGALMVPLDQVLVMHFLLSKVQGQSALLKKIYIPRVTTISHVEIAATTEYTHTLQDQQEIERIAKWLDIIDN